MATWTRRLATFVGGTVFLGGIVLFALAVPKRGSLGWELVLGEAVPGWAFATSFVGGPLLILVGLVVGMRYGNFERYHRDYDEETGTIDSDHPIAILNEKISSDRLEPDDPPEKFVFTRTHLVATVGVLTVPFIVFFFVSGFDGWFLWLTIGMLVVAAAASVAVTDYLLRHSEELEYGA